MNEQSLHSIGRVRGNFEATEFSLPAVIATSSAI